MSTSGIIESVSQTFCLLFRTKSNDLQNYSVVSTINEIFELHMPIMLQNLHLLIAWILEHNVNLIFYILGILGVACACVLSGIVPSSRPTNTHVGIVEYDREHCSKYIVMIGWMFKDILFNDFSALIFLYIIGLAFTNMMIAICLIQ